MIAFYYIFQLIAPTFAFLMANGIAMNKLSYVKYIYENEILISCEDKVKESSLHILKAKRKLFSKNLWMLKYHNKNDLAEKLQILNNNNFMFLGGGSGWNPVDVFISMREENLGIR